MMVPLLLWTVPCLGQHDHGGTPAPPPPSAPSDGKPSGEAAPAHDHSSTAPAPPKPAEPASAPSRGHDHDGPVTDEGHTGHATMPMAVRPLDLPHSRDASGTAWQPDATPIDAIHAMRADWSLMLHFNAFAGWDEQGTDRGDAELTSVNWLMLMATRPLAGGELSLRGMFSAEAWTVGDEGYPLLLQSGETAGGEPLHDRQHPHDLFMEVGARYTRPIGDALAFDLYVAPAGEPALGPVAFPHRASAASDPLAPLGHHWQDATHISFGVATVGFFGRKWKVEGSWFNGREPDEQREDFDLREPDSWSGRLSLNPTEHWSVQVSTGMLESPEALEPEVSIRRTTASVAHAKPFRGEGRWATTWAWGRNEPDEGPASNSFLVESDLHLDGPHSIFGRLEHVRKSGHDLVLEPGLEHDLFDVTSVVVGYAYDFPVEHAVVPSIGVRASANFMDDALTPFYGDDVGYGGMVFFRIRPRRMAP